MKKMPFMFRRKDNSYIVMIATWDYKHYDSSWMQNSLIGTECFSPDVDTCDDFQIFNTEKEAITFIIQWWKGQP